MPSRPEIGSAAAIVWSIPADSGARFRASTATYSASVPLRHQSVNPEYSLADSQAGGPVTQFGNHPGDLVAGNSRRPITPGPVGPCARPVEFTRGEPRRVHPDNDVVLGGVGIGHLRERKPIDTGGAVPRVIACMVSLRLSASTGMAQ